MRSEEESNKNGGGKWERGRGGGEGEEREGEKVRREREVLVDETSRTEFRSKPVIQSARESTLNTGQKKEEV